VYGVYSNLASSGEPPLLQKTTLTTAYAAQEDKKITKYQWLCASLNWNSADNTTIDNNSNNNNSEFICFL